MEPLRKEWRDARCNKREKHKGNHRQQRRQWRDKKEEIRIVGSLIQRESQEGRWTDQLGMKPTDNQIQFFLRDRDTRRQFGWMCHASHTQRVTHNASHRITHNKTHRTLRTTAKADSAPAHLHTINCHRFAVCSHGPAVLHSSRWSR